MPDLPLCRCPNASAVPVKPVTCKGARVILQQNDNAKIWTLQPIDGSPGVYHVVLEVRDVYLQIYALQLGVV